MNNDEMKLLIFSEECVELAKELMEVSHQVSKALRFGLWEQRDLATSNAERIVAEWNDLTACREILEESGLMTFRRDESAILAKKEKVHRYMAYSRDLGVLTDEC